MERKIQFTPNNFYHIYNRGIDKKKIFYSEGDWKHFQRLLHIRNDAQGFIRPDRVKNQKLSDIKIDKPLVNIQAYCLMPNHFHILLSEIQKGGITSFMRKLLTSYSMYMNKKYDRTGPLMCRPFQAQHIDSDEYMRWVISYIHLNPVEKLFPDWKEKGMKPSKKVGKFIKEYQYSSYADYYTGEREESVILNKQSLPFFISDLENVNNIHKTFQQHEDLLV